MEDGRVTREPLWRESAQVFIIVFAATRLIDEVKTAWRTSEWADLLVEFAIMAVSAVAVTAIWRATRRNPVTDDKVRGA